MSLNGVSNLFETKESPVGACPNLALVTTYYSPVRKCGVKSSPLGVLAIFLQRSEEKIKPALKSCYRMLSSFTFNYRKIIYSGLF